MTQPDFSKENGNNLSNRQISEEKPIIASSSSKSDERGERLFNILFGIMIIFTIIGTGIIIQKLNAHCKELIELAPEYNFPNLNDLIIVPPLVIFLAVNNFCNKIGDENSYRENFSANCKILYS